MSSYAMHVIYMGQLSHVVLASLILHGVQCGATICFLFTFQDFLEHVKEYVYLFKELAWGMIMILHLCLFLSYGHILCGIGFFYLNFLNPCLCVGSHEFYLFKMATWRILWSCIICAWSWFYDLTLCFNKFIYIAFQDVLRDQDVWQI